MSIHLHQHLSPIGLDFGARSVAAVQLRRRADRWEVFAAAEFPRAVRNSPPSLGEMIRAGEVLERSGFRDSTFVAATPHDIILTTSLDAPGQPGAEAARAMARIELSRSLGCPPEAMEMALWTLPAPLRSRDTAPVLVSAVTHRDAQQLLDGLESGGLRAAALEPRICALARACASMCDDPSRICTIIDLSDDASATTVVYRGVIVYGRANAAGGLAALESAIAQRLGVDASVAEHAVWRLANPLPPRAEGAPDWSDAGPIVEEHFTSVARDAAAAIAYAGHRYPEAPGGRLILSGPGAEFGAARDSIHGLLGLDAAVARPSDLVACPAELATRCRSPGLTTALGLAMHEQEEP
jgi:Tfp pilus assembly PilM family ATPase